MTQAVADKKINLSYVAQASDLLQRVLKCSVSDEQMQAIALAVGSGQDPTTVALARMIKVAYKRNPAAIRQLLMNQLALIARTEDTLKKIADNPVAYLRHRLSIRLASTKGSVTIAGSKEVFASYIDVGFKNGGSNQAGADTAEAEVDVHEVIEDGTYKKLFGALGRDLRSLCLQEGQIVEFCETHREHLRQGGHGTKFLFQVGDEMFVANVCVYHGKLCIFRDRFEDDDRVWLADHQQRLVVLKQTP